MNEILMIQVIDDGDDDDGDNDEDDDSGGDKDDDDDRSDEEQEGMMIDVDDVSYLVDDTMKEPLQIMIQRQIDK